MSEERASLGLPPGATVGRYRVRQVHSEWGFYLAYLAEETETGRLVLVHELLPEELVKRSADGTLSGRTERSQESLAWARERFLAEGRGLMACAHPAIQSILHVFEANGTAYWVTPAEEGRSFKQWLQDLGHAPTEAELRPLLAALLPALAQLHAAGWQHLNLKPETIRIAAHGQPMLMHFASSRQAIAQHSHEASAVTTGYSPIEQYDPDKTERPATDIYSLGAVLHRAVTGKAPPEAPQRIGSDPYQKLAGRLPGAYSASFLSAIDAALAPDATARPQNIEGWSKMLEISGEKKAPPSVKKQPRALIAGAAAVAAILLAAVLWHIFHPTPPAPPKDDPDKKEKDQQAELAKKTEQDKKKAEEMQKAEEEKAAEEKKKAEEARLAELEKKMEEQKKADEEKQAADKAAEEKAALEKQAEETATKRAEDAKAAEQAAEAEKAAAEQAAKKAAEAKGAAKKKTAEQEATVAAEKAKEAQDAAEKATVEKVAAEQAAEKAKEEKAAAEEEAAKKAAAEKTAANQLAAVIAAQKAMEAKANPNEKTDAEKAAEEMAAKKAAGEKIAAEKAEAEKQAANKAAADKAAVELAAKKEAEEKEKQNGGPPPLPPPSGGGGQVGSGISGVWETKQKNANGQPLKKLIIYPDAYYELSGDVIDSGIINAKLGVINMTSEKTNKESSSTFKYKSMSMIETDGPLGKFEWVRTAPSAPERKKDDNK